MSIAVKIEEILEALADSEDADFREALADNKILVLAVIGCLLLFMASSLLSWKHYCYTVLLLLFEVVAVVIVVVVADVTVVVVVVVVVLVVVPVVDVAVYCYLALLLSL